MTDQASLHRRQRAGFTLIELLVVIAIIAILAAILFPVFARAREKAHQTACLNNQRQLATAVQIYAQDHNEALPEAETVWEDLRLDHKLLVCPSAGKIIDNAYVYVAALSGMKLGEISLPSETYVIGDGQKVTPGTPNTLESAQDWSYRHAKKLLVAYLDGHVEVTNEMLPPLPLLARNGLWWWLRADYKFKYKIGTGSNYWVPYVNNTGLGNANTTTSQVVSTTPLNGFPGVYFNRAAGGCYDYTLLNWLDTDHTLVIAFRPEDVSTGAFFCGGAANVVRIKSGKVQVGGRLNDAVTTYTYTTPAAAEPAVTANAMHYLIASWSRGAGVAVYVDQVTRGTFDPTIIGFNNQNKTTYIGTDNVSPEDRFKGDMGEVILYNRLLKNSELVLLDKYLKAKYAIP